MTTLTSNETSDAELARRAGDRDDLSAARTACGMLCERYQRELFSYLVARLARSDAEHLLQETWLRVWKAFGNPGRFDGKDFKAWAFEIARNLYVDHIRKKQIPTLSLQGGDDRQPIDMVDRGEPADPFAEQRERLIRCLKVLDDDERAVVQARTEGLKPVEIAGNMKVTRERIDKLFHRAKAKLTACIERSRS